MRIRPIAVSALFAAGLAALPLSRAEAQYYSPLCNPFPLTWPFCVAGAVVGTAATIATAPFVALAGPPRPYPPPPVPVAAPGPAPAPAPGWPGWRWRRWCRNHPWRCHW